jgi:hypothetical protein
MMDLLLLWQAATDATVASAANEASRQWSYEQIKDFTGYVIGLLVAAFLAWQNQVILRQNVVHEKNAEDRAERRGDPKPERRRPFPGEKR